MRELRMTLPELALIAGTRAAFGAGVAFLLADRLPRERRMAVGWTLVTLGAVSSIPLAFEIFGRESADARELLPVGTEKSRSGTYQRSLQTSKPFVW
jgi:hypothetical protein